MWKAIGQIIWQGLLTIVYCGWLRGAFMDLVKAVKAVPV